MNTNIDKTTVQLDTKLTTNILLQEGGTYVTNVYNEWAQFVGYALQIKNEEKQAYGIRFECKPFVLKNCSDIHKAWVEFHNKCMQHCSDNPTSFSKLPNYGAVII